MKKILKGLFGSAHIFLAKSYFLSRYYLLSVGSITRALGDNYFTKRIVNHLANVNWPDLVFPPREVRVCKNASIHIIPHVGEFDFRALFSKNLSYEDAIFAWLLPRMAQFDAVFEIGANVGVYSVFFSKYGRIKDQIGVTPVYCFEPSRLAYSRLLANIATNPTGSVIPLNSAVSEVSGFVTFFEPDGHLTNGSLDAQFAGQFADNVRSTTVSSLSGADVLELAAEFESILLKIDVEGAEHRIIQSLESFVLSKRPVIIIEVLSVIVEALNKIDFLVNNYHLYLMTPDGLQEKVRFEADSQHRDYCLLPRKLI